MKETAKRSGVKIGVWQGRIKAARMMFDRKRRETEELERALALGDGVRDWSSWDTLSSALKGDIGYRYQSIPLSYRYAVWLQSKVAGEPPVVRYPRTAGGDETFAATIEDLLLRIWAESGSHREWKQAIFDLCGFGSTCVWYGFHADLVDAETAQGAGTGAEETVTAALQGSTEAAPGQDRGLALRALETAASDPVNRVALPLEAVQGLTEAQINQIDAAEKEMGQPVNPAVEQREIWARRLQVGRDVIWDQTVTDIRDARWMARRVVMSWEQAKNFTGFGGGVRRRVGDHASKFGPMDGVEEVKSSDGTPMDPNENGRFVFWQILDKEYETQHYVSEVMPEFLEADETYPFLDPKTGRPAIPGFFPAVVSAPIRHSMNKPERTLGVPLIEAGYHVQKRITELHDFAMASVKRHSSRSYLIHPQLPDEAVADLEAGVDGALIRFPEGVDPKDAVTPVQFSGEAYRIVELIQRLTAEWAMLVGMPLADLTSQPQADTATAESISVDAGRGQADHVIRCLEEDMAQAMEIIRAILAIGLYPPEKIAALLGPGREAIIEAWQASSLDGDRLTLKSASRAKADQAVRIKQLGDALSLVVGYVDPKLGVPVYDARPIVEELLMALDVGRPKQIEWTPEDLMLRAAMAGGAPQGGAPSKGPGQKERAEKPTDAAHESAAARRTGS